MTHEENKNPEEGSTIDTEAVVHARKQALETEMAAANEKADEMPQHEGENPPTADELAEEKKSEEDE